MMDRVASWGKGREASSVPVVRPRVANGEIKSSRLAMFPPWLLAPVPRCAIPYRLAMFPARLSASLPFVRPPGMITWEEARYYYWLGQFFSGAGEAVELGPWLGLSTFFIVRGLERSRRFPGKRLHVFDAFVWHEYMDRWYAGPDKPAEGESFLPLFERLAERASIGDSLVVEQRSIFPSPFPSTKSLTLETLSWSGGPIEFLYVDCGFTFAGNEAWWRVLSPHFIPGKTVVAMQDWQSFKYDHRPLNELHETKVFTDSKGGSLKLIHELRHGAVGTFLFSAR